MCKRLVDCHCLFIAVNMIYKLSEAFSPGRSIGACKEPPRSQQGACKYPATSLQGAFKEPSKRLQGAFKQPAKSLLAGALAQVEI